MRLVEKKKFRPVRHGQQSKSWVRARSSEVFFICTKKYRLNACSVPVDLVEHRCGGSLEVPWKRRIAFCDIPVEYRRILARDPIEPFDKDRLIRGEMSDILEGAPFSGN